MTNYKLYDKNGVEVNHSDLQSKKLWCKNGEQIEEAFVEKFGDKLKLKINPEKSTNPYAPDLVYEEQILCDLKTQNTPFFKAEKLFGIDPTYAVVFNRKDAIRYYRKYPDIVIYFWVEWHSVKFEMSRFSKEVEYLNGVYKISFKDLIPFLKKSKEHSYQQRVNDRKGNAKSSFVLDLRDESFIKVA
ncbi:hypothetical protein [Salegentibacter sp. UBA1130]|uniref:hypothetical protein n=1 Tax=Salegentibacter sp. UBA1130 TaxID=1947451 RepID=UPI00257F16B1|nr:hypothetical protein [Salegentibacter sp. UBA1130]